MFRRRVHVCLFIRLAKRGALLLLLLLPSFSGHGQEDDSEIVLRVGKVAVSKAEYLFLYNDFVSTYERSRKSKIARDTILEWQKEYVDNMLFLADAYAKHYDNVEERVTAMSKLITAQPNGELHKRLFGQTEINEDSLRSAYQKRKEKLVVSYIHFADRQAFQAFTKVHGTQYESYFLPGPEGAKDLLSLKEITLIWPVNLFHSENVWNLKPGEILGPVINSQGVYLVRLDKREPNVQQAYEALKPAIKSTLTQYYEINAAERYYRSVFNDVHFDSLRIARLFPVFQTASGTMSAQANEVLVRISRQGVITDSINFQNMLHYRRYQPLKRPVVSLAQFYQLITDMIIEDQLYLKAQEFGITTTNDFVFRKNRFRNGLILGQYYDQEIRSKLPAGGSKSTLSQQENEARKMALASIRATYPLFCRLPGLE